MKWYEKYLSVYGKPYADVPAEVMDGIRNRLRTLQSDEPLVSVVVIAYNEGMPVVAFGKRVRISDGDHRRE